MSMAIEGWRYRTLKRGFEVLEQVGIRDIEDGHYNMEVGLIVGMDV